VKIEQEMDYTINKSKDCTSHIPSIYSED